MMRRNLAAALVAFVACVIPLRAAEQEPAYPHLRKQGEATQLIVNGKPFIALAGELNNSSSSSLEYMKPIWTRLQRMNLNTVVAPISWELIEPEEGEFDFALVDGLIRDARASNMKLVFLWFGSWKNGLSSYPPVWVKNDPQRFPLARDGKGTQLDILSTYGEETAAADGKALAAVMRRIREIDANGQTVIAVQVENEVGMRGDSRDRSPAADKAFNAPVPAELMQGLIQRGDAVVPELRDLWKAAGGKTSGTWTEVFGDGLATDEAFMAWSYARYVGKVAAAGKQEYPIPMYTNAWLDQPGTPKPGDYPSGGPLAHVLDIWQIGAPSLDILAPDLYVPEFAHRCQIFTRNGNPLFIPETNTGDRAGANALYAFGQYNAICFSPFGIDGFGFGFGGVPTIDQPPIESSPLAQTYAALKQFAPLISANQGKGAMQAVLIGKGALDESVRKQELIMGDYKLTIEPGRRGFRRPPTSAPAGAGGGRGTNPQAEPDTWGGIFVQSGADEFTFLTTGLSVSFNSLSKPGTTAVASIDEGSFDNTGNWVRGRRLNGDQTDHNRQPNRAMQPYKVIRVKLYQRP